MKKGDEWSAVLVVVTGLILNLGTSALAQEKTTYQDHVLPLIENHCARCHNPDKKKGDLDLTSYNGLMKGGGSGAVVISGGPESSKLYRAITHAEEPTMPPNKPKLPEKELAFFQKWIAGGLLETSGSKAVAAKKPEVDLTLKLSDDGKPEGPPPIPEALPMEPVVHTRRETAVTGLAASPWAPLVALTGQKQVLLYDTDASELIGILPFAEGQPVDVRFSRSGRLLIIAGGRGGRSGKVAVWDVVKGEQVTTVGNEYDSVLAADISPDQSRIALGGPERLVKIYATSDGELRHKIKKHTDWVTAVAFSPNGQMLASADRSGGISIWDPESGQEIFTLQGHKQAATALSWRADSKILASASEDGTIKWWELENGRQAKTWTAHNGGALAVTFVRDGRLVSCGRDKQTTAWNNSGDKSRSFGFEQHIAVCATFTYDAKRVVAANWAGDVVVWEASDGRQVATLDANPPPLSQQIAAVENRIDELQKFIESDAAANAEREAAARLDSETESAAENLGKAQARQTEKEEAVRRLKEEAAKPSPPADIDAQLAKARGVRAKAREAATRASELLEAKKKTALDRGASPLDKAKGDLVEARKQLGRLKVAQSYTAVHETRVRLVADKREYAGLLASAQAYAEAAHKAEEALSAANDASTKTTLKAQIESARADAAKARASAEKLGKEVAAAEALLEKLMSQYQQLRTAQISTRQQADL